MFVIKAIILKRYFGCDDPNLVTFDYLKALTAYPFQFIK